MWDPAPLSADAGCMVEDARLAAEAAAKKRAEDAAARKAEEERLAAAAWGGYEAQRHR